MGAVNLGKLTYVKHSMICVCLPTVDTPAAFWTTFYWLQTQSEAPDLGLLTGKSFVKSVPGSLVGY
jgi:hypothetical protein